MMDPSAPLTAQQFTQAVWALVIGFAAPWVVIFPVWWLIERWRDRKASREAQERLRRWDATHPRAPADEHTRLAQIKDQLFLESLPDSVRAHILRQRLEDAEREAQARAIWEAERRGEADGR
jgi:hypothetical protein